MATSKIKVSETNMHGGDFEIEYVPAYEILQFVYKQNGHEYAIHFTPTLLNFYVDGTKLWTK